MNHNTRAYLRRNGMSAEVVAELDLGRQVLIDADGVAGWLRVAFESGQRVAKGTLAAALWPLIEKTVLLARAEGYSEGYEDNKQELLQAERAADKRDDELHDLKQRYALLEGGLDAFADVAADTHCWLDGIALGLKLGIHGDWMREEVWVPNAERARALSAVLKNLRAPASKDDEIPF